MVLATCGSEWSTMFSMARDFSTHYDTIVVELNVHQYYAYAADDHVLTLALARE